jgi:hypothetical protein
MCTNSLSRTYVAFQAEVDGEIFSVGRSPTQLHFSDGAIASK